MLLHVRRLTSRLGFVGQLKGAKGALSQRVSLFSSEAAWQEDSHAYSYAHGVSNVLAVSDVGVMIPVPLLHVTIGDVLRHATEQTPDREAFVFRAENVRKTYEQFLAEVTRCASGMLALGLRRGDRIGIWSSNKYEWVLTKHAAALAGLILVNVNPASQALELQHCVKQSGMRMLVMCSTFKSQNCYNLLHSICPRLTVSQPGAISDNNLPDLRQVVIFESEKPAPGTWDFHRDLMVAGDSQSDKHLHEQGRLNQPHDPVNVQYTSGTTGVPKGATLTHHNVVNNAYFTGIRCHFHEMRRNVICVSPPLYHCFGFVVGALSSVMHNATCIYASPSWEPLSTLKAIHDERATTLYGTPTMFIDLVSHPDLPNYDMTSLETGIMAGAPCPVKLCTDVIEKLHCEGFTIAYGSTETSPVTFQSLRYEDPTKRISSIGLLLPHNEAAVVDAQRRVVPLGEKGELLTRGYTTMIGYWNDPVKTNEVITQDRWDQATMDAEGRVRIVGRTKDCIIRGGENIYPAEIEDFLFKHPKIAQIQVVGVPDERFGEAVCAWIVLNPGETATADEIQKYCKGKISHFKIPRYIQFKNEQDFPKTLSGKVQKYKMIDIATKELGLAHVKSHFS